MNKIFSVLIIIPLLSCRFVGDAATAVEEECISARLAMQKNSSKVVEIRKCFDDTFRVWKRNIEVFGSDKYLDHFVDDMVFLSRDSSKCILLVLKRAKDGEMPNMFGTARVIKGIMHNGVWNFSASQEFLYEKDFFVKYHDNSFGTISKLARHSILKTGKHTKFKCEIDESYWFQLVNESTSLVDRFTR